MSTIRQPSAVSRHDVARCPWLSRPSLPWAFLATLISAFLCGAVASRTALAATRAYNFVAPAIYVEYVSLAPGETVKYETDNLSTNADPVMHFLRVEPDGSYTPVDYSDDISWPANPNSRIIFTNGTEPVPYVVVLRAYSSGNTGTCDVRKNGLLRKGGAPIGGWLVPYTLFTFLFPIRCSPSAQATSSTPSTIRVAASPNC